MNSKIMEENLARLLHEVDYKSCGSDPEPYELTQVQDVFKKTENNRNQSNKYEQFNEKNVKKQQIKEDQQFVNPFDKKLFKDRRLRKSSVYSVVQGYRNTQTASQYNIPTDKLIANNKSMMCLGLDAEYSTLPHHNENDGNKRSEKISQLCGIFRSTEQMLNRIKGQMILQMVNNSEKSEELFQNTKENLLYVRQYLNYHYGEGHGQSKTQNHEIDTQQYSSKGGNNQFYVEIYNSNNNSHRDTDISKYYSKNNDNGHILQILDSHCPPRINQSVKYKHNSYINDENDAKQSNLILPSYDSIHEKSLTKNSRGKRLKSVESNQPKSIYESVLEERRNRIRNKKSRIA